MKAGRVEFRHHVKTTEYPVSATVAQATAATTDTCVLTHPYVLLDSTLGATTLTLPDGEESQMLILDLATDGGNLDVSPTTSTAWSELALDDAGDMGILFYVDDTIGWIILGLSGKTISPLFTA